MKTCGGCKIAKDESCFSVRRSRPSGVQSRCKDCQKKAIATYREFRPRDAARERNANLKSLYGIDNDAYSLILSEQGGVCAICKLPPRGNATHKGHEPTLAVDHDHGTGKIRGLLCSNCNKGIGNLKENLEILRSAMLYLAVAQ